MIYFIKHIDIEGPDTLGDYLRGLQIPFEIISLEENDGFPDTFSNVDAVISLGGPMNVDQEDKYPFLKRERLFIDQIVHRQIPFLGICLGSQLLARACQAGVVKSPRKEIGWSTVTLTSAGQNDPLFRGMNSHLRVFQWHEDMFEIPPGGQLLAGSSLCPHQAFRVGSCAYGLQFHVEITDQSITNWTRRYSNPHSDDSGPDLKDMLEKYYKKKGHFDLTAQQLYDNFLLIIQNNLSERHQP